MNKKIFLIVFLSVLLVGMVSATVSYSGASESNFGGYLIYTFTSDGTFNITKNYDFEILVVAGGAGAGGSAGGGGGAGGYLYENLTLQNSNYKIEVGAGGTGGINPSNGGNSLLEFFNTTDVLNAIGGGSGAEGGQSANSGGSGGGGSNSNGYTAGASGTAGQGYAGGNGAWVSGTGDEGSGGGGGAGGSGLDHIINAGGAGGSGLSNYITGVSVCYAGGGGGGGIDSSSGGSAICGGGAGSTNLIDGLDAEDGLGSGGGGGGSQQGVGGGDGGDGGNGIVILRVVNTPLISTISISPTNNTITDISFLNFSTNLSITDGIIDYNWTNITYYVWFSNGTLFNQTFVDLSGDGDVLNNSVLIDNFLVGDYLWNFESFYANDTYSGSTFSSSGNFSFKESSFVESFYSAIAYETSLEYYGTNLSESFSVSKVYLNYSNTINGMTSQGNGIYNVSKVLSSSNIGNNSVQFIYTVSGVNDTIQRYQQVNPTLLGLCNATLTVPYINLTFKDEETLLDLNASIDASTWTYWLGDGTVTKSLLFSNTSENKNYAFCLSPGNVTLKNNRNIQYASTGYPQRKYDASNSLTNVTTNTTLYLLSSADGIYSTIQVVNQDGDKVEDVEVTVERQFSGVWTVIGQETTDAAGLVTFWLNPDYDHRFTFVSDDCTGTTNTLRPTQTQYTQQLQCGASDAIYVSQIEGIKYARTPATGIIQPGTYNFSFQIVSSKDNLINVSMELVNASSGVVLNSTYSACTPSGCTIYVMYKINGGDDIKGKYYIDVGNGTILLEGDARWRAIDIPTEGKAGLLTFMRDMRYVIDEWGDDSDTADFNRLVIIFFFMALAISALNYQFGNDSQNPGAFLVIMTIVILFGSLSGSFVGGEMTGQGFFYFNNLTGNSFINNYILVFFTMVITISYFINLNRRAQQ